MQQLKLVVVRILKYQIIQGIIASLVIIAVQKSVNTTLSALSGLMLGIIPNLIYGTITLKNKVLSYLDSYKLHKKAMIIKFVVNLLSFLVVFVVYHRVNTLVLFAVYIVTLTGNWTSILRINRN